MATRFASVAGQVIRISDGDGGLLLEIGRRLPAQRDDYLDRPLAHRVRTAVYDACAEKSVMVCARVIGGS